jgi:hypothetical protein
VESAQGMQEEIVEQPELEKHTIFPKKTEILAEIQQQTREYRKIFFTARAVCKQKPLRRLLLRHKVDIINSI